MAHVILDLFSATDFQNLILTGKYYFPTSFKIAYFFIKLKEGLFFQILGNLKTSYLFLILCDAAKYNSRNIYNARKRSIHSPSLHTHILILPQIIIDKNNNRRYQLEITSIIKRVNSKYALVGISVC